MSTRPHFPPIALKLLFYCQLSLSCSTSILRPVDSLRPGKRWLCCHLSRNLVWTLRSKISVLVSNLFYISKLSEKAGAEQFMEHLTANNVHSHLQSAYKQQNSMETALLKVKNGILMSMNEQHVTSLVLLDLSAAFDAILSYIMIS